MRVFNCFFFVAASCTEEAADTVAAAVGGDVVQVIGTKFVLYKKSNNKDIKNPIVLVR